jgi:hypothetical protein
MLARRKNLGQLSILLKGRSGDVSENKGKIDKMADNLSAFVVGKSQISR